eukprot:3163397-Pyramimonas_sp.AAC.1
MAPKGKAKAKPKAKASPGELAMPQVSDADLAEAKRILQSSTEKCRTNSNVIYWLNTSGKRVHYDSKTPSSQGVVPRLVRLDCGGEGVQEHVFPR